MTGNPELTEDISRQADRLAVQLAEHARELESRPIKEGRALVKEAQEAIERLLRNLGAR
jgi:fructose-1,6-bisphosphatase/inositol monophosphatase family enzyme